MFEHWDKFLNTLGEWGIKIRTFGKIWIKTRGQNTPKSYFCSADTCTGALGAQLQGASACPDHPALGAPNSAKIFLHFVEGAWGSRVWFLGDLLRVRIFCFN